MPPRRRRRKRMMLSSWPAANATATTDLVDVAVGQAESLECRLRRRRRRRRYTRRRWMRARRPRVGRKNGGAARRAGAPFGEGAKARAREAILGGQETLTTRAARESGNPPAFQTWSAQLLFFNLHDAHTRRSINYGLQGGGGSRPRPSKGLLFRQCRQGLSWGSVPRQSYPQQSGV
jgi:hypothetical protein